MLDQQDGDAAIADAADQLHEGVGLRGVHAGDRLVEQQHRRLGRQRERHADETLLAVGQRAGEIVGAAFEADPFAPVRRRARASACSDARARGRPRMASSRPTLPWRCSPISTLS